MAFSAWRVAVIISGQNLASGAFASLSTQAAGANQKINAARISVLALRATALTSFAAIGVAFMRDGVNSAAAFQMAMEQVRITTGATTKQITDLGATVTKVSTQ